MSESDQQAQPSLRARVNPILLRLAKLRVLWLVVFILIVFPPTRANDLYDSFTKPPPGHDIAVPDNALTEDDALAAVLKVTGPVDKVFDKVQKDRNSQRKHCGGLTTHTPVDWSCVDTVVRETADLLKGFDAWLASSARYKLDRPADLDRHIRIQGIDVKLLFTASLPNFWDFLSLSRALAYRSLTRWRAGDPAGAERDLRTIFALGSFLQQNPIRGSHMPGLWVHDTGLSVLVTHLSTKAVTPGLDSLLPAPQPYVDGLKVVIGAEWLSQRELIRNDLARQVGISDFRLQVLSLIGSYSEVHTQRLLAGDSQATLRHIETGIMASSISKDYWREVCSLSWTWPFLTNFRGRMFACGLSAPWDVYLGRTGQTMDRLAATHVVLAARRFKQTQGRWPTQESDLVPVYLKAWPTSALDGQPLRWLDDKSGILILGDDGKKPCESSHWCRLSFDPPLPVAVASKRAR